MAFTIHNRLTLRTASSPTTLVEEHISDSSEIAEGLTISQATELLDWLEAHNLQASDVRLDSTGRITVVWTH